MAHKEDRLSHWMKIPEWLMNSIKHDAWFNEIAIDEEVIVQRNYDNRNKEVVFDLYKRKRHKYEIHGITPSSKRSGQVLDKILQTEDGKGKG